MGRGCVERGFRDGSSERPNRTQCHTPLTNIVATLRKYAEDCEYPG
jgi:hypothetical protein